MRTLVLSLLAFVSFVVVARDLLRRWIMARLRPTLQEHVDGLRPLLVLRQLVFTSDPEHAEVHSDAPFTHLMRDPSEVAFQRLCQALPVHELHIVQRNNLRDLFYRVGPYWLILSEDDLAQKILGPTPQIPIASATLTIRAYIKPRGDTVGTSRNLLSRIAFAMSAQYLILDKTVPRRGIVTSPKKLGWKKACVISSDPNELPLQPEELHAAVEVAQWLWRHADSFAHIHKTS